MRYALRSAMKHREYKGREEDIPLARIYQQATPQQPCGSEQSGTAHKYDVFETGEDRRKLDNVFGIPSVSSASQGILN